MDVSNMTLEEIIRHEQPIPADQVQRVFDGVQENVNQEFKDALYEKVNHVIEYLDRLKEDLQSD